MTDTAYIPRAADVATRPMPRVDTKCAHCGVGLFAVRDPERPPMLFRGEWFHNISPEGCYWARRRAMI